MHAKASQAFGETLAGPAAAAAVAAVVVAAAAEAKGCALSAACPLGLQARDGLAAAAAVAAAAAGIGFVAAAAVPPAAVPYCWRREQVM